MHDVIHPMLPAPQARQQASEPDPLLRQSLAQDTVFCPHPIRHCPICDCPSARCAISMVHANTSNTITTPLAAIEEECELHTVILLTLLVLTFVYCVICVRAFRSILLTFSSFYSMEILTFSFFCYFFKKFVIVLICVYLWAVLLFWSALLHVKRRCDKKGLFPSKLTELISNYCCKMMFHLYFISSSRSCMQ